MENVDFDKLEALSIAELGAVVAYAKNSQEGLKYQKDTYGPSTEQKEMQRRSLLGTYYEELHDSANDFLSKKIFAITGDPLHSIR